jgi:hypothetical protein
MTREFGRFTARRLFEALDGRHFDRYSDLESAVRDLFTEHVADFPIGYDHLDAITLAERRRWISAERGGGVVVNVDKIPA